MCVSSFMVFCWVEMIFPIVPKPALGSLEQFCEVLRTGSSVGWALFLLWPSASTEASPLPR